MGAYGIAVPVRGYAIGYRYSHYLTIQICLNQTCNIDNNNLMIIFLQSMVFPFSFSYQMLFKMYRRNWSTYLHAK